MPDDFLDPILERLGREARATFTRAGQVTAIDALTTSMTVDCAGDVITGVRWYAHYTPVVGDFVDLLCVGGSSWRALGVLDNDWTAPPTHYEGTVDLAADAVYAGFVEEGSVPTPWAWPLSASGRAAQGRYYRAAEWPSYTTHDTTAAGVWLMPALSASLPDGATILSAKLRATRVDTGYGGVRSPQVYQHTYAAMPSGAPSLVGTVWAPGGLLQGESASWDLPSAWVTNWLAGTIRGFAIYSDQLADLAYLTMSAVIAYRAPIVV